MMCARNIILTIIALLCIGCSQSDVKVQDLKWSCNKSECDVSFKIVNSSFSNVKTNYVIRAHKQFSYGKAVISNEVMAERRGTVILESNTSIAQKYTLKIREPIDNIVVSAWAEE